MTYDPTVLPKLERRLTGLANQALGLCFTTMILTAGSLIFSALQRPQVHEYNPEIGTMALCGASACAVMYLGWVIFAAAREVVRAMWLMQNKMASEGE